VLPANYGDQVCNSARLLFRTCFDVCDQVIQIWGGYSEVTAAKDLLHAVIARCMKPKPSLKQLGYWSRVNAYKADKERDVDVQAKREQRLQELRKAPSLPNEFEVMVRSQYPKCH
jgi:hypothetical protein